jgi:predicted metal-binding membrane protein
MARTTALEVVLKRDRAVVIGGLVAVITVAWIYTLTGAGMDMSAFEMTAITAAPSAQGTTMGAMTPLAWTPAYAVLMVFMWWVMMMAMMLPSATPMILLFATFNRKRREQGAPYVATGIFALGYVLAWGAFSVLAAGLQWSLERLALLTPMMVTSSVVLGGLLLIAGGVYQLTPLKHACLRHCRSPFQFIAGHWRTGRLGAFQMGVEHGVFCLGCCWVLMALLFYGGIMNLYWIAGLALYVLIEKMIPQGHRLGFLAGLGLIVWGCAVIAATVI